MKKFIKFFLVIFVILVFSSCSRLDFNPFDYKKWDGAKLKIINKNKKDSGYYFTTRGPKVVLKKKLPKNWDEIYYNSVSDIFSVKPYKQKPFIFY